MGTCTLYTYGRVQTRVYDTLKVHNILCVLILNNIFNSSNYNDLLIVLKFNNCH